MASKITTPFKLFLPGLITVMLVIAGAVNLDIFSKSSFIPLFAAMSVYYWAVYRPEIMSKPFIFALGLFQDLLYNTPLGITSLLLLLLWWIVSSQRRFLAREAFFVVWLFFALSVLLYECCNWLINSVYYGQFLYSSSLLLQFAATILLYPLIHKVFSIIRLEKL